MQGAGTYWSGVNSCCMMPTKPEGEGFTFSSAGNRAPELWRQNTVRVVLKVVCSQNIRRQQTHKDTVKMTERGHARRHTPRM